VRVFLDANILFAAAYQPDGRIHILLIGARGANVHLMTSDLSLEEARRNLGLKASPAALGELDRLARFLEVQRTPSEGHCPFPLPPKDQPLFWAARSGGATHFLTGDLTHFGAWMNKPGKTAGIRIQTAREFFESI